VKNTAIKLISTENASPAGGHYSQAAAYNGLVFVSGQLGFTPGTNKKETPSLEVETYNCLENMRLILKASGADLDDLIKVTIYISDVKYWPVVNAIYASFLGGHKPARAIVPCKLLHHDFNVEIEAVAKAPITI